MANVYAMSDIHGELETFEEMLSLIDFSDPENKLFLLGDYIDHKHLKPESFRRIMELQHTHEGQVVCLMGNHEAIFLGDCGISPYCEPQVDYTLDDCASMFPFELMLQSDGPNEYRTFEDKEVLSWLRGLPMYYETDAQIFVHAGIEEDAEDLWMHASEDSFFREKYPPTTGVFYKDIIAGHIGTHNEYLANDEDFHDAYWDGANHLYIDGASEFSHKIPLLKYDTQTGNYTSFEKLEDGSWIEYSLKERLL